MMGKINEALELTQQIEAVAATSIMGWEDKRSIIGSPSCFGRLNDLLHELGLGHYWPSRNIPSYQEWVQQTSAGAVGVRRYLESLRDVLVKGASMPLTMGQYQWMVALADKASDMLDDTHPSAWDDPLYWAEFHQADIEALNPIMPPFPEPDGLEPEEEPEGPSEPEPEPTGWPRTRRGTGGPIRARARARTENREPDGLEPEEEPEGPSEPEPEPDDGDVPQKEWWWASEWAQAMRSGDKLTFDDPISQAMFDSYARGYEAGRLSQEPDEPLSDELYRCGYCGEEYIQDELSMLKVHRIGKVSHKICSECDKIGRIRSLRSLSRALNPF